MRRIKAVASPSQLCLWDELLDEPAALRQDDVVPAPSGGGLAPPAATRPDVTEARPEGRTS